MARHRVNTPIDYSIINFL